MLVDYDISGMKVHDARLVASMRVHGVSSILTFNTREFKRFDGIRAVSPSDLIADSQLT